MRFLPDGGGGSSAASRGLRHRQTPSAQCFPARMATGPRSCAPSACLRRYSIFQVAHAHATSANANGRYHGRAAIANVGYYARDQDNSQDSLPTIVGSCLCSRDRSCRGRSLVRLQRGQQASHLFADRETELRSRSGGAEEGELHRGRALLQLREAEVSLLEVCRSGRTGPRRYGVCPQHLPARRRRRRHVRRTLLR